MKGIAVLAAVVMLLSCCPLTGLIAPRPTTPRVSAPTQARLATVAPQATAKPSGQATPLSIQAVGEWFVVVSANYDADEAVIRFLPQKDDSDSLYNSVFVGAPSQGFCSLMVTTSEKTKAPFLVAVCRQGSKLDFLSSEEGTLALSPYTGYQVSIVGSVSDKTLKVRGMIPDDGNGKLVKLANEALTRVALIRVSRGKVAISYANVAANTPTPRR